MARTVLPDFQTLTEFDQFHGDCFFLAWLCGMHSIDPQAYPLTLGFLDVMVADAIARGFASAQLSGGIDIDNASRWLDDRHIAHTTVSYDEFARRGLDDFHGVLKALSGKKPIIVEWGNGGALHGDEPLVRFHYSCDGGVDSGPHGDGIGGGYLWGDGDNRASTRVPSAPILYTWPNIGEARPIAYIILDQPRKEPQTVAQNWTRVDGNTAKDAHGTIVHWAMAAFVLDPVNAGLPAAADDVKGSANAERYIDDGVNSFVPLADGSALWYNKQRNSTVRVDALLYALLAHLLAEASKPAPAPTTVTVTVPAPIPDKYLKAYDLVTQLKGDLSAIEQAA